MRLHHLAWLLTFSAAAPAQELWIPQGEIPAALKDHPRAVLLTREQYEKLRRDAQPPLTTSAEAPPAPAILRSLTMKARPAGDIVIAEAELSVDILSAVPAALPLQFAPATLAALTLDEASTLAAADGEGKGPAALLPPGRHTLKATLHYPVAVSAAGPSIAVCGAAAGASSFTLTLGPEERIESALTFSTTAADGKSAHMFLVPADDKPHAITWSRRDIRDLPGTALMQSCDFHYTLDAVRLRADLGLTFTSRLAALPTSITLPVPAEARVLDVSGPDVLQWTAAAEKTSITVSLTPQPDRHEVALRVELDLPLQAGKALALPFPQAADVHRASGRFVIHTQGDLRVRRITAPPLAVQSEPEQRTRGLAGQWDFAAITEPPQVEVEALSPVFHATQDTQVALQRDAVHLTRHLLIVPRQSRLFQVLLTVPAGEEIISLTNQDGSAVDWRKLTPDATGTPVEVRFPAGLKPGDKPVLRLATRLDPPQWAALPEAGTDLKIARVGVAGADKLSGFLAVAAEDRFAVSPATAAGLEPRDPATLGDDVPVRGGFVWFAPGDFTLPLHVAPRAAEFDATLAAFAMPLRHGVEIEGALELDIRQSGLRALTVQLPPAAAPHWRCASPLLSSSAFNQERSEWLLSFRDELRGPQSLRWHLLLPVQEPDKTQTFSADLPALGVIGARRTLFHWVVEANTDTELTFDTTGLDERDTLTLPAVAGYTPRHRVIAAWAARGSDWRLALTARRHQTAPLPALVVGRYDLTTSVSAGALRHQAVLTVRSNGQQFLDLPLPPEARMLSLLVNGAPQKPAASTVAALRAQLPAGDADATVTLTWELPGTSWNGSGQHKIEPLRFHEDIPVIESTWTLRLPEGSVYSGFTGDMERVNAPAVPEFGGIFARKSSRDATASESEFLSGGGGGGGGGAKLKMQILQSSAPDVFGMVQNDQLSTMSGNWVETQFKAITSAETMQRVVKNLKLDEAWGMDATAAAERLASMVEVEQERGTEIVTIHARSSDSAESARIVRAVAEAYQARRTENEQERLRRLTQTVDAAIQKQTALVDKARLEMNDLQKKHSIVDRVPLSIGGTRTVIQAGTDDAAPARGYANELETDLMRMETALKGLAGLKGEQLIAGAMELGVQNTTIQKLYPEYQELVASEKASLKSGYGPEHPKIKGLREAIRVKYEQLLTFVTIFKDNLEIKIAESKKMLEAAEKRTMNKETDSITEGQNQSEYAAAKHRYESSLALLSTVRELAARSTVDEGALMNKAVEILSTPPAPRKDVAGLLPLEIALPDAGQEFRFRGFHAPGAMTFSARSLHEESRVAWLWIAAGLVVAGLLARRRTVWRGLLVALVLWLGPWIAGAGFGVCHRLLIGWALGCMVIWGGKLLLRARGVPVTAAATAVLAFIMSLPTPAGASCRAAAVPVGSTSSSLLKPQRGEAYQPGASDAGAQPRVSTRNSSKPCRGDTMGTGCRREGVSAESERAEEASRFVTPLQGWHFSRSETRGGAPASLAPGGDVLPRWGIRGLADSFSIPKLSVQKRTAMLRCQKRRAAAQPESTEAEPAESAPEAPRILVPYDPAQPLANQNPQQVYVDYAHFQKLWQQARDNRLAKTDPPAPALAGNEAAIVSALYEATLARSTLKVEAVLTIHANGAWAALDLRADKESAPFAGAGMAALTLDGKAAVLHGGLLLMETPGRHVLRASLQAPLPADWRAASLHLPPAPATLISLAHGDPSLRLRVNGGLPMEVSETREPVFAWRGTAAAGATAKLTIERIPAVTLAAGSEKPALGAVRARLLVTPAIERLDSRIDFAFAGADRREFSFAFDAALTPVQLQIANLESWSLREADGRRVLDFKLSVPARDGFTAGFVAERAVQAAPGAVQQAPAVVPAANRQEYTLEILSSDELDLNVTAAGGWARAELQGMGGAEDTGFRKAGAWRLAGAWSPLTWTASARALRRSALVDYAWKIAGGMMETTATLTLRAAEHEDLSSLTIPLPPGAVLQTLDGERLADWWRDGDALELRFSGATAETTTFFLDFTQPLTDAHWQSGVVLPGVVIPGFDSVKGRGVIVSGPETDVRVRLDNAAGAAREVEPEKAAGDYRFLPPLVLRRGFTFDSADFKATALLERVTPRYAVRWVLGAAVQDSWTETQFRADVEVSQGALPVVTFTLPAGMPEARVSGPAVRETIRTARDSGAEYHVVFQSPVTGATALTIALELPHQGRIALPDIAWPGAELTERFLIMQNLSNGEVVPDAAASSGVEPLSRDGMADLHFMVQGFSSALAWRLQENWKLAAVHRALETTSGPAAVVLWAELTTMLRPQGPEWLRAVYHLQNRALQFLPLRLPDGMQLVSVTVAGTAVRADAGTLADGKPGLLIPLIQTRPGDLAMDVEIVCRTKGDGKRERVLDDPDIPGVSVQRTLWNVWTPQDWQLGDAEGNMERVEEQKSFMDKLEGEFSELDSLLSLSSMSKRGKERDYAWSQSSVKIEELETKLKAKEADYSGYRGDEKLSQEFSQARERLTAAKNIQQANSSVQADDDSEATANFANSDKWVWDYNSSYLQKRRKAVEGEQDRAQLLLDSSALLNGGVTSGNIALQSLRKPAAPGEEKAETKTRAYQQQIAVLNDAPQQQAAQSGKDMTKSKPEDNVQPATQQLFNDVRGAQRRRVTPPTNAPATVQMVPGPNSPMVPRPAIEMKPDAPATPPPAPPMLKPAGRVSIPVNFPLDGTVQRFRKVNDGASLKLTMEPVGRNSRSRWLAAGVLAAGLGLLWATRIRRQRGGKSHQRSPLATRTAAGQGPA